MILQIFSQTAQINIDRGKPKIEWNLIQEPTVQKG